MSHGVLIKSGVLMARIRYIIVDKIPDGQQRLRKQLLFHLNRIVEEFAIDLKKRQLS